MTEEHEHQQAGQPTEEEMRRALEEEMRRVTVDDLLLQATVSLINLAGRKAGLAPGTEGERDLPQVKTAIEAVNALLPILEVEHREEVRPIRDALSQLQMAYAQLAGAARGGGESPQEPPSEPPASEPEGAQRGGGQEPSQGGPGQPGGGPAQRSGRLWVPGQ